MKTLLVILLLTIQLSLAAIGFGGSLRYGRETGDAWHDIDYSIPSEGYNEGRSVPYIVEQYGFEIFLDTAMFKERTTSFRFRLGQSENHRNWGKIFPYEKEVELDTRETHVGMSVGFCMYRTKNLRLWFGPRYQFSTENGEEDFETSLSSSYYRKTTWRSRVSSNAFGVVYGVNYRLFRFIAMSAELSVMYRASYGEIEIDWIDDGPRRAVCDEIKTDGYLIILELFTLFSPRD